MDTKDDTQQYPQSDLIILAGRRDRRDAFLHMHNVDSKGLIPMNGLPLISYVMDAAQNADICRSIVIVGETDLFIDFMLTEGRENIHLVEPEDTIVDSLEKAFAFLAKHYKDDFKPVLVTTADHPLLNAGILTDFYTQSVQSQAEATFGFTFLHDVLRSYPKTMRTKLAFKDGMISGCNLFFFGTKNALSLPAFWQEIQHMRKSPLRMAKMLGPVILVKYMTKRLTLDALCRKIATLTGVNVGAVRVANPRAAIDVDKQEDYDLVKTILLQEAMS